MLDDDSSTPIKHTKMKALTRKELAKLGEKIARDYLSEKGIEIIANNFRTGFGEIDLIGKSGERYIFFEVKARQSDRFGYPEEAVNSTKLKHIEKVAWDFFELNNIDEVDWQIDVIAVFRNIHDNKIEIKWIENVLD